MSKLTSQKVINRMNNMTEQEKVEFKAWKKEFNKTDPESYSTFNDEILFDIFTT